MSESGTGVDVAALKASEAQFRALWACSPLGIFCTDSQGRCLYANARCEGICGFSQQEARGNGWARYLHPEDRERVLAEWGRCAQAGQECHQEFRVLSANGVVRWISARSAPMHSDDGDFVGHVGTVEDITARKELEEQLRLQARQDALTGLWNRATILESLAQERERAARNGSRVAVILADLDGFKQINDTYGHLAGDAVLREAAQRLRHCLRPYDKIGRYGGEEFLILVPECDARSALAVARRLRGCIEQEAFAVPEGTIRLTGSLGVAVSGAAGTMEAASELIGAADTALYRAKNQGRNRVELSQSTNRSR